MDKTSGIAGERATIPGAIDTGRITLLGVAGPAGDRRAVVRLSAGGVRTVTVGDVLNGGRVIAISLTELRCRKSGRIRILILPF